MFNKFSTFSNEKFRRFFHRNRGNPIFQTILNKFSLKYKTNILSVLLVNTICFSIPSKPSFTANKCKLFKIPRFPSISTKINETASKLFNWKLPTATDSWMKHSLLQKPKINLKQTKTKVGKSWKEETQWNIFHHSPVDVPKAIHFLLYTNSNQAAIAWKCALLSSMIHETKHSNIPKLQYFRQEGSVSLSRIYLSRLNNLTFYIKKQISNCFRHRHVYCESRRGFDAAFLFISPRRQTFGN